MTTVAVIGVNGILGQPTIDGILHFKDQYKLPIRVFTRDTSKTTDSAEIKYYSSSTQLDEGLKGTDVLIDLTNPAVDSAPFIDAAAKNGVKVYFPSEFGTRYLNTRYEKVFGAKIQAAKYARSKGLKTVQVYTALFSLVDFVPIAFGIDPGSKTVKVVGDGSTYGSITVIKDIGLSLGSLAHRSPTELPDEVFIQGQSLTQNDVIEIYEKSKNVKLERVSATVEEILEDADKAVGDLAKKGDGFALIIRAYVLGVPGSLYDANSKDNDLVNPGLFKWGTLQEVFK